MSVRMAEMKLTDAPGLVGRRMRYSHAIRESEGVRGINFRR